MVFDRTGSEPLSFDPEKVGRVTPALANADGFKLSAKEFSDIFGIDGDRFGDLPKRFVVPELRGRHHVEQWYLTEGNLYLVEPVAWVPKVSKFHTMAASAFKSTYTSVSETIESTKFNASASAEVSIEAGGSYYGITASVKSNSSVSFAYSKESLDKDRIETLGITGEVPIHQLVVYPLLRCKIIKVQRIEYTANNSSEELKWETDASWGDRWVADKRLGRVQKLALNPVPTDGNGIGGKVYILPFPEVNSNGDVDVTTIISRQGWIDWYVYDAPWKNAEAGKYIDLAAPSNDTAFRPMATWTTLVSMLISFHTD